MAVSFTVAPKITCTTKWLKFVAYVEPASVLLRRRRRRRNFLCIGKNNTNSDVTTSTKVLCRAARIAETITAGRPTYIKFTQAVNKTTPPTNPTPGNQKLHIPLQHHK